MTTAFLNDCLTNLQKYLAIVVYNDWSTTVGRHTCDLLANQTTTWRLVEYFWRMFAKGAHVCRRTINWRHQSESWTIFWRTRRIITLGIFYIPFLPLLMIMSFVDLMLGHRLRRWPSIKSTLSQRLVFAGSVISIIRWFTLATRWSWCIMLVTQVQAPFQAHSQVSR